MKKMTEVKQLYYYPENLAAKATFWLWELRDLVIIVFGLLLSILALTQTGIMLPLIATPQLFEWRPRYED